MQSVPGMGLFEVYVEADSPVGRQYVITYEPGDATHYMMSVVPARWARMTGRLGTTHGLYWQLGVWSGSGAGNGTMVVEAGDNGAFYQDDLTIQEQLHCSAYSSRVFSIMIHGCLASHNPKRASDLMAEFRAVGRMGFVEG